MAADAPAPRSVQPSEPDLLDTTQAGPAAIQGGAMRVAGYVLGVGLSVGSAALLFRYLGVADAGRYVTALSLVTIAGGLSDLGLTGIGVRELSVRDAAGRAGFVRSLLGLRTTLTTIAMIGIVGFAVAAGYPAEIVVGTGLAGIGVLLLTVQGTFATGLVAQLRLGWVTLADLLRQVVLVAGIVVLVVIGAGLVPFLAIQIPASLAALVLTVVLVRHDLPLLPSFDRSAWRALLREILPFALASTLGVIYFRLAIVLLSLVSTAHQTGYFSASFRIIEVLLAVPQLLVTGAFPILARAARDDHQRLGYAVQRLFEVGLVGGVGIAMALILGAPIAIAIVGGSAFSPSIDILRIQAITLGAMFVNAGWAYALLSLHRYREILWLSISGVVLAGVAVAIFGSAYGAIGAAWATTGVDVFQTMLLGVVVAASNPNLRPHLAVVPRVAVAALAAGALALIPGIPTLVLLCAGMAAYIAVALLTGAVPDEILVEARRGARGLRAAFGR